MPVMTAKEIVETFKKFDKNETILVTWWLQTDFPDYDLEVGDEELENNAIEIVNWAMTEAKYD